MGKHIYYIIVIVVLIAVTLLLTMPFGFGVLQEQGYNNTITVVGARAVALPMGGGVFMKIVNGYPEKVCLVKAELAGYEGAEVELHRTVIDEKGVARMQPVDKICIDPGSYVELKHGGYHLMIMNAKLNEGSVITLRLYFDNGDVVSVDAPVKAKGG